MRFREWLFSYLVHQHHATTRGEYAHLRRETHDLAGLAESTASTVDELVVLNYALLELLQERTGITDDEIQAKIDEVRNRRTQRAASQAEKVSCSNCDRLNSPERTTCWYCGSQLG